MSFSVEITDQFGNQLRPPSEVELRPAYFDWSAIGGPKTAEIRAIGRREGLATLLGWLGYRILIRNVYGQPCWWGFVGEVLVGLGAYSVGRTLDGMYNRIAVAYTYEDADNETQRGTTEWIENQSSVVRYGAKELLHSHADLEGAEAAQDLAEVLLARFGEPKTYVRRINSEENTATLICWGHWTRTGWKYYKQLQGREAHESSFADQVLGVGVTSNGVSFVRDGNLVYPEMGEHGFRSGDKVTISGSAHNNGTKTVGSSTQAERWTYASNQVFFDLSNDMYDLALGFDGLAAGDTIRILGANPTNNGVRQVDEVDIPDTYDDGSFPAHFGKTVHHVEFTTDTAPQNVGDLIHIHRYGYFKTDEPLADEAPGRSVTILAWGQKIAQRVQLSEDAGPWPLHEIRIRLRKVGSPSDGVKVRLCADGGGVPGSTLREAAILHGSIGTEAGWESFPFDGSLSLQYDTNYWIVVERTGAPHPDDYYEVGVDDGGSYTPRGETPAKGDYQLYTGTAWEAPPVEASLAFEIVGKRDTGAQIGEMILAVNFTTQVDGLTTFVMHPIYRDGDNLIADEIEQLAKRGDDTGRRIVIDVTPERRVDIRTRPAMPDQVYVLRGSGSVLDPYGDPLPPGFPLIGKWVRIDEPGLTDIPAQSLTFYVWEASYDTLSGQWALHPEDAPSPYDVGLQQG